MQKNRGRLSVRIFDRYPILKPDWSGCYARESIQDAYIRFRRSAYIGSANLTGAGIGMKSGNRRPTLRPEYLPTRHI